MTATDGVCDYCGEGVFMTGQHITGDREPCATLREAFAVLREAAWQTEVFGDHTTAGELIALRMKLKAVMRRIEQIGQYA